MSIVNTEGLTLFGEGSEWFWVMAQFVIVAITLVGIYAQLKVARNANAFEQANALTEELQSERLTRRRLAILEVLIRDGLEADLSAVAASIGNFWENAGGLVRRGHVDLRIVYERMSSQAMAWWTLLEPEVRRFQTEQDPTIFEHFEWMVRQFVRLDRDAGTPEDTYSREKMLARLPEMIARERAAIAEFEAMRTVIFATPPTPPVVATPPVAESVGDLAN